METLPALVLFVLVATITPGPNNVMVATAAAHHGVRATIPHMAGIAIGFAAMIVLVGLGVAGVLTAVPGVATVLRWVAIAWLLVLAWKIAHSGAPGSGAARPRMGFWGAVLFQWVNPKAWLMAVGATSAWIAPGRAMLPQLALIALVFLLATGPCILLWALLGSAAGRLLNAPHRLRAFNLTMALLLVASMVPVMFEG